MEKYSLWISALKHYLITLLYRASRHVDFPLPCNLITLLSVTTFVLVEFCSRLPPGRGPLATGNLGFSATAIFHFFTNDALHCPRTKKHRYYTDWDSDGLSGSAPPSMNLTVTT